METAPSAFKRELGRTAEYLQDIEENGIGDFLGFVQMDGKSDGSANRALIR